MRKLSSMALAASLLALGACEDSTGNGEVWRAEGLLDNTGSASVMLPRDAGTPNRLPALTCYTSHPQERVWFLIGSVEDVSNCILEPAFEDPNRLMATIEGETPGWLYHFVVVY